jgi:hypothetical protein
VCGEAASKVPRRFRFGRSTYQFPFFILKLHMLLYDIILPMDMWRVNRHFSRRGEGWINQAQEGGKKG